MKAILILGVIILVGGGVWFLFVGKNMNENLAVSQVKTDMNTDTVTDVAPDAAKPSMIASLNDAMSFGSPLQCTYSASSGQEGTNATVYVSGKKFKTEAMVSSVKTEALFDGETQYVWTSGSTQGMKMSQGCLERLKSEFSEKSPVGEARPEDYQQTLNQAQNVKCEPVETDMSLIFAVPKDITFVDQCAMMEQSKKMMDQVKGMVPTSYPGR